MASRYFPPNIPLIPVRHDGAQTAAYLAGPMRGLPEYNFPAFRAATADLRARGFHVWSPAERDEQQDGFDAATDQPKHIRHYMSFDLPAVLTSDAVVVLPGWETSKGATLEVHVARECEIPVYIYPDLTTLDATPLVRTFETGATRDLDDSKPDPEGFFSPAVFRRRAEYMQKNRVQPDGSTRASDNWQRGIPLDAYMKSGFRHFVDWWALHRGNRAEVPIEEAICALLFNAEGYLHELLKEGT